jgi:hypothetical protein
MLHVEIIQNEWASGLQRVVARVVLADNGLLDIEAENVDMWREIALKPFRQAETGTEVSPASSTPQLNQARKPTGDVGSR